MRTNTDEIAHSLCSGCKLVTGWVACRPARGNRNPSRSRRSLEKKQLRTWEVLQVKSEVTQQILKDGGYTRSLLAD